MTLTDALRPCLTISLRPNERALLLRDGRPRAFLRPGRHRFWPWGGPCSAVTYDLDRAVAPLSPELASVLPGDEGETATVPEGSVGLVSVDGRPTVCVEPGRYVLWKGRAKVSLALLSLEPVMGEVPRGFADLIPDNLVEEVLVLPYERALLFVDGSLHTLLGEGRHFVFKHGREVDVRRVDMREQGLQIVGQEVLTADKASLRVSLLIKHRIVDPALSALSVVDLNAGLYSEAQIAYRRYIAGVTVEQLLEQRNEAGEIMRSFAAERVRAWGVELVRMEIKDVILPGDLKALFNRVIEAEKQAQAQNIARREETAATRSMANTARLLENNPTLLRLRELETWKEIAGKVGKVTVAVSPQQLAGALSLEDKPR